MNRTWGTWLVVSAMTASLAACGSGSATTAPTVTVTSTPTETAPTFSAGDTAACAAYGREQDGIRKNMKSVQGDPMPIFLYAETFKGASTRVRDGMVAATDAEIVGHRDATVAAFDSAMATVDAWIDGKTLDLSTDLSAVYQASTSLAAACDKVDPSVTHQPLIEP